jgi:hypothetical protein
MKILIVQRTNIAQKAVADVTKHTWEDYAEKHGYGYLFLDKELSIDKHPTFIIQDTLLSIVSDEAYKMYDYIFWADIDSVIMNTEKTLESLIVDTDASVLLAPLYLRINYEVDVTEYDVTISDSSDGGSHIWLTLNTGHIFVKNNAWSATFLNKVINYVLPQNSYSEKDLPLSLGDEWATTLLYLLDPDVKANIGFLNITDVFVCDSVYQAVNIEWSTSLRAYAPGDFIVHASGIPIWRKVEMLKNYVALLHFNNSKWLDINLVSYSYENACPVCLLGSQCPAGKENKFNTMGTFTWNKIIKYLRDITYNRSTHISFGTYCNEEISHTVLRDLTELNFNLILEFASLPDATFLHSFNKILNAENTTVVVNFVAPANNSLQEWEEINIKINTLRKYVVNAEIILIVRGVVDASLPKLLAQLAEVKKFVPANTKYLICSSLPHTSRLVSPNVMLSYSDKQEFLMGLHDLLLDKDFEPVFNLYEEALYIVPSGDILPCSPRCVDAIHNADYITPPACSVVIP